MYVLYINIAILHVYQLCVVRCLICLIGGRNCLSCASTWVYPRFLVGSVCSPVLVFCVMFFALLVSSSCVLCAQCCQFLWIYRLFLVAPSVFSNVYRKKSNELCNFTKLSNPSVVTDLTISIYHIQCY